MSKKKFDDIKLISCLKKKKEFDVPEDVDNIG